METKPCDEKDEKLIDEPAAPSIDDAPADASGKRKGEWKDVDDSKNTSVYVSGLPTTITEQEFISLMEGAGIIAKRPIPGNPPNIRLYKNKDGTLKGDGCCKYLRKESIDIAITRFDEYQYDDKHVLRCEKAKFEPKASFDPSKRPRIDPKAMSKQRKQMEKMLSWDTRDPPELKQKVVVLKEMFTVEELAENPTRILELRDSLEQRCAREIAEPKRVQVHDTNPDGIITITFNEPEQARACVHAFKSYFEVDLWDGKTKYKIKETDAESERRLEKFEQDIQETNCEKSPAASESVTQ